MHNIGGETITLFGTSFGPESAKVIVGGRQCTNVIHDSISPDNIVRCITPANSGQTLSVTLFQDQSVNTLDPVFLSYQPCAGNIILQIVYFFIIIFYR